VTVPPKRDKEIAMSTVRENYCAKVKSQLDELNAKVDALEVQMHEANEDARASHRAQLDKLHQQSDLVATELAQIKTNGEASWGKLVQDMDKMRDGFMQSLNYFKSQI
jgi:outer membrane murein-binding lipoprotein Lpp